MAPASAPARTGAATGAAKKKKRGASRANPPPRRNLLRDRHGRYVAIDADMLVAAATSPSLGKKGGKGRSKSKSKSSRRALPVQPQPQPQPPAEAPRRRRRRRPRSDVPTKLIRDRYGRYVSVPLDAPAAQQQQQQQQQQQSSQDAQQQALAAAAATAPVASAPEPARRRRRRRAPPRRQRRPRDSDSDSGSDSDSDYDSDEASSQADYNDDDAQEQEQADAAADGGAYYTTSETVTEDYGDSHSSRFWPTMAAMVSILIALGAAGLNFLWFDKVLARHPRNPLVPFYERLGQIGSTFVLATLLALFVLGSTYNLESPFAILFGVIAVVFVMGMVLSRSGEVGFLAGEDIFMVALYGATIMSLVSVVASGDLTAGLLMLPMLALLAGATLEYNGVVDFSKTNADANAA